MIKFINSKKMCIKDIVIGVIIAVNIISDSLVIWSSGNILPAKNDTNTTNSTTLYLDILDKGKNMFLDNIYSSINNDSNISSNLPLTKYYDEYGIEDAINFYKKAHKGLYFTSIFAFIFIIMLGFSYLVKDKNSCDCDLSGGFNCHCDLSGSGEGACGICLGAVFFFFLALILVIMLAIGQKPSRLFALFGQMVFAILYIVWGVLKGREDGVYKFVLLTIIVGGITAFFNFVAMILIIIDIDTCTLFGFNTNKSNIEKENNNSTDSYQKFQGQNNEKVSDENTPNQPAIELKTSIDNSDNNNSEQNTNEPNQNEQNPGYDNNDGNVNDQKETLISSSTQ